MAASSLLSQADERVDLERAAAAKLVLLDREYQDDPWLWLCEEVLTIDETGRVVKPWPLDKLYLKDLMWAYQHHNLIAVPKSRRVMASWLTSLWLLHSARYERSACFWQSDTESHAAYALDKRCAFAEDHLVTAPLRRSYQAVRTKDGLIGRINFQQSGGYIWAIPQGDSVIRSYTFSRMVMDECEFQPEAHRAFTAAIPIAEKGAQLILISTSNGSQGVMAGICREAGFVRFQ